MKALALAIALLGPIQALDDTVRQAVQDARRPATDQVMRVATDIGKPVVVFGVLLGIAAFDRVAGPATARLALAALLGTNLTVEGLKRATFRVRPDGEHKRSNAAFPSSHAANAFALAWVLARRWRRLAAAFWLLATLVAFSRIYLDRHWLSDVVAGALLGTGCAWATARWFVRRPPDRAGTASVPEARAGPRETQ